MALSLHKFKQVDDLRRLKRMIEVPLWLPTRRRVGQVVLELGLPVLPSHLASSPILGPRNLLPIIIKMPGRLRCPVDLLNLAACLQVGYQP